MGGARRRRRRGCQGNSANDAEGPRQRPTDGRVPAAPLRALHWCGIYVGVRQPASRERRHSFTHGPAVFVRPVLEHRPRLARAESCIVVLDLPAAGNTASWRRAVWGVGRSGSSEVRVSSAPSTGGIRWAACLCSPLFCHEPEDPRWSRVVRCHAPAGLRAPRPRRRPGRQPRPTASFEEAGRIGR